MGYRLMREHWGRGYASEAGRAVLDLAFNTHRLPYVASKVAHDNIASRRVIEKTGGRPWKEAVAADLAQTLVYRFDRQVVDPTR